MKQRQCSGQTKAGERCKSWAMPDSEWCINHDPNRVTDLAEWRKKGGKQRSNQSRAKKQLPAEPLSIAELHSYLGVVFRRVVTGQTEPAVGTAAATIARTMAELSRAADFEERMTAIEQRLTGRSA